MHPLPEEQSFHLKTTRTTSPLTNTRCTIQLSSNQLHRTAPKRWGFRCSGNNDRSSGHWHPNHPMQHYHHHRRVCVPFFQQVVLWKWLPIRNYLRPGQSLCVKILENVNEAHRYSPQNVNIIPPTDWRCLWAFQQDSDTMPEVPCRTESKRMGQGSTESTFQYNEHG